MALQITDQNFEELVAQGKPMLIEFGASWCGPCRKIGPYIDDIAKTYEGQAFVGKVDIEECDELVDMHLVAYLQSYLNF